MSNHFKLEVGNNSSLDCRGFTGGMCATNGYAFKAPNGWVLVDAPQGAVNWLEKEGIDPQLILLTHQHFDHVLGAGSVSVRFNCPIWAFADYAAELTLESLFNHFEDGDLKISPYTIERKILIYISHIL